MEKEEILKQMGKKLVEAMEPEKAKEVLLGALDGRDVYEEILGTGGAQGLKRQEGGGHAGRRMRWSKPRLRKYRKCE